MELILAVVSGTLFAASFYLLLRRNLLRFVIGVIILGNAVNLLIFTMGRLTRKVPPVIPYGQKTIEGAYANPLPQALILTAIVISFGLLAFTLVLIYRNYTVSNTIDADKLTASEPPREVDLHTDTKRLPA
jgi:multicomponent Na+:H+ antiporter subunit C